jgi:hypothetical protein
MRTPAPYPSKQFPDAKRTITRRARFLYGVTSYLARQVGITRQAFNARADLATESRSTHEWFEFVLCLPEGSLSEGVTEEAMTRPASPAELAYAVAASDAAWAGRKTRLGRPPRRVE